MTNTASVQGSSATDQTMTAFKRAQESLLSENIKITSASASNPGIPPSSLMTFSKKVLDDCLSQTPPPPKKNQKQNKKKDKSTLAQIQDSMSYTINPYNSYNP